jgi:hypothetical protein
MGVADVTQSRDLIEEIRYIYHMFFNFILAPPDAALNCSTRIIKTRPCGQGEKEQGNDLALLDQISSVNGSAGKTFFGVLGSSKPIYRASISHRMWT